MNDAHIELARRAVRGEPQATRELLTLVAPKVLASVRSVIGPTHADLEDVVQESLIAVLRALPSFRGDAPLVQFAKQIAIRRAIDALRKTIRYRHVRNALEVSEEPTLAPTSSERSERWRALLSELPAAQAETLVLRAVEEHSIEEIAKMTSTPVETVRSRLRLAKAALRERLAANRALLDLLGDDHDR